MTSRERLVLGFALAAAIAGASACNDNPPAPPQMPPAPAPGSLADPSQPSQAATAVPAAVPAAPSAPTAPSPAAPSPAPSAPEAEPQHPAEHVEHEKTEAEHAPVRARQSETSAKLEAKSEPPAPEPPKPEAAEPGSKVTVPHTDHVHVDVPKGLQHWLDADTRMQPWLDSAMKVVDGCYADERKRHHDAAGTITIKITMHENERPDADIESVPSKLGGMIACATAKLMRTRPPLFTGKEGDAYTARVHFTK